MSIKKSKSKKQKEIIIEKLYSIGEASKKLNLATPTLRMYERNGILIPYKAKSGRRFYSDADIERIKCIKHLIKDVGLNLEGLRRLFALLPCWQITKCSKKDREKCPVYLESTKPCWTFQYVACRKHPIDCKSCDVYLMSSTCTDRLKSILMGIGYLPAK